MRIIQVSDKLSGKQFERLAQIVGIMTDAMVDNFYGSFEIKMEKGTPLPYVPKKESVAL